MFTINITKVKSGLPEKLSHVLINSKHYIFSSVRRLFFNSFYFKEFMRDYRSFIK